MHGSCWEFVIGVAGDCRGVAGDLRELPVMRVVEGGTVWSFTATAGTAVPDFNQYMCNRSKHRGDSTEDCIAHGALFMACVGVPLGGGGGGAKGPADLTLGLPRTPAAFQL